MPSIFEIEDWIGTTDEENPVAYVKNAVVKNGDYYYYSTQYHIAAATFAEDEANGLWGGVKADDTGEFKPHFIWEPSYNSSQLFEPKINSIQFGDGYVQRFKRQINNNLLQLSYNFDNIDINKFTAINHFLSVREGEESFLFTPPEPFNALKKFVCQRWSPTFVFYDNYSVAVDFKEVPN